jgi:hypothetical protein
MVWGISEDWRELTRQLFDIAGEVQAKVGSPVEPVVATIHGK